MIERAVFFGGPQDGHSCSLASEAVPFRDGESFEIRGPADEVMGRYVLVRERNFVFFRWAPAP